MRLLIRSFLKVCWFEYTHSGWWCSFWLLVISPWFNSLFCSYSNPHVFQAFYMLKPTFWSNSPMLSRCNLHFVPTSPPEIPGQPSWISLKKWTMFRISMDSHQWSFKKKNTFRKRHVRALLIATFSVSPGLAVEGVEGGVPSSRGTRFRGNRRARRRSEPMPPEGAPTKSIKRRAPVWLRVTLWWTNIEMENGHL